MLSEILCNFSVVCLNSSNIWQSALAWLSWIRKWRQNAKTRKQLANLDPSLYQDIGLTVTQIHHEVQKKFWQ